MAEFGCFGVCKERERLIGEVQHAEKLAGQLRQENEKLYVQLVAERAKAEEEEERRIRTRVEGALERKAMRKQSFKAFVIYFVTVVCVFTAARMLD